MNSASYINSLGKEYSFSMEFPYILKGLDGVTEVGSNEITHKAVRQDGESYSYSELEKRQLILKFALVGDNLEHSKQIKDELIRTFNPKLGEGKLIYTVDGVSKQINVVVDSVPSIIPRKNRRVLEGEIILIAHDPYWTDIFDTGDKISTWIGGWKFKFKLPFKFKQKGETQKNIYNSGHVNTPIEVVFKGPAINPTIVNETTGEFIRVERTLTSDDTLYINTEFGNKTVEIEKSGKRINAFNYIDLDSTFFNLKVGDNLIKYTTEDSDPQFEPQSVELLYKNKYVGI